MKPTNSKLLQAILVGWLIAGAIDITSAIFILSKGHAAAVLRYIASALMGKGAREGGTGIQLIGLSMHFGIALAWTLFYFLLYTRTRFHKINIFIAAPLYGIIIYSFMTYMVLPLTELPHRKPFSTSQIPNILKNVAILSVAFGVTLKIVAQRFKLR